MSSIGRTKVSQCVTVHTVQPIRGQVRSVLAYMLAHAPSTFGTKASVSVDAAVCGTVRRLAIFVL